MWDLIKRLFLKFKRFITFSLVGIINFLVDLVVYSLCLGLLKLPVSVSYPIGYACGLLCGFILNRKLTFGDRQNAVGRQLPLFVLVNLVSLSFGYFFIGKLVEFSVNPYLAKIITQAVAMLINYFGYKYLVFRKSTGNND